MHPVRRQISPHAVRLRRDMTDVERHLAERDAAPSRFLEDRGYRVLRFWNGAVVENLDRGIERVRAVLLHGAGQRKTFP